MRLLPTSTALLAALLLSACQDPTTSAPTSAAPAGAAASAAGVYAVSQWGPKDTPAGVAFNAQSDGNSGLWFKVEPALPAVAATGSFGGKPLQGVVAAGNTVTATIPADYLSAPGDYPIVLELPSTGARIEVGTFTVKPAN